MKKYESEETEVKKGIAWLEKEIEEDIKSWGGGNPDYFRGASDAYENVKDWLNQLDEPEVLSSDWISKNVEYAYFDMLDGSGRLSSATAIIKPEKLQNLLVPKQGKVEEGRVRLIVGFDGGTESYYATDIGDALDFLTDYDARFTVSKEPVIPQFVAEWISERNEIFDLYPALKRLENSPLSWEDVYEWYRKNTRNFVDAYLTGKYTVEEEQRYYVLTSSNKILLTKDDGEVRETYQVYSWIKKRDKERYQLTEQEIKDYDERYMSFAVKVEELEE